MPTPAISAIRSATQPQPQPGTACASCHPVTRPPLNPSDSLVGAHARSAGRALQPGVNRATSLLNAALAPSPAPTRSNNARPTTGTVAAAVVTIAGPLGPDGRPDPVHLAWDPVTYSALAGYNMYRSDQAGTGYAKLNAEPITDTEYFDDTVEYGRTYYYVCTAVGTQQEESGYSNEVSFDAPPPPCPGDVNLDGERNIVDVMQIMNHVVGTMTLTGRSLDAADVNQDGVINIADAVRLQNHIVGNAPLPPCP